MKIYLIVISTRTCNNQTGFRKTAQQYGGECTFSIKGSNVCTKTSIGNIVELLDPRIQQVISTF